MKFKSYIFLTATALLLTACAQQAVLPSETAVLPPAETATKTPFPTHRPRATMTPAPTRTQMPTRPYSTPTATPTFTPTPELSFSYLNDPLFPIIEGRYIDATTTPIPTPQGAFNSLRLVDLSIDDYVELLQMLDNYAYENDTGVPPGYMRFPFVRLQSSIKIILQEAFLAFPETQYSDELLWKRAMTNATSNNYESDEWIINTINTSLDQQLFTLDELNFFLNQYGFEVDDTYSVENLFGDGATIQVFVINSQHQGTLSRTDDGLVVALRGDRVGNYELIKMASHWDFANGAWGVSGACFPQDSDHYFDINNNGVPEFCLVFGSYWTAKLYLLEWQEDKFINLAEDLRGLGLFDEFIIQPLDKPEIDLVLLNAESPNYEIGYRLVGNRFEQVYEESFYVLDQFFQYPSQSDYTPYIEELSDMLTSGPPYMFSYYQRDPLSDEGTDYLIFLLGMVYALDSNVTAARNEFLSLAQGPTVSEYPLLSEAAEAFLENYSSEMDLYKACNAVMEILFSASESRDYLNFEQLFGIENYSGRPYGFICNSNIPLIKTIQFLSPSNQIDLPTRLQQLGVEILQSQPFDALNDGRQDWIITTNLTPGGTPGTLLVVQHQNKWESLVLFTRNEDTTNLRINPIELPGLQQPVFLVSDEGDSSLIRIFLEQNLLTLDELIGYGTIVPIATESEEIFVSFSQYSYTDDNDVEKSFLEWIADQWNEQTQAFTSYDFLNNILFEQEGRMTTIQLIQQILDIDMGQDDIEDEAHLLYLLGLAYELLGDEANAVQTYWRVWTEFPNTPYAIMARAKLEPVSP